MGEMGLIIQINYDNYFIINNNDEEGDKEKGEGKGTPAPPAAAEHLLTTDSLFNFSDTFMNILKLINHPSLSHRHSSSARLIRQI